MRMNSKQGLKAIIGEYIEALQECQLMARLMRSGHVEAETLPDGTVGFRLTDTGWADIANLPVPDLPERPFGTEITLYKETGTQCWRMTDGGWKLAWWDPMNGADNWI